MKLEKNLDILEYLGKNNKWSKYIMGFSAETENLIENSKIKLKDKPEKLIEKIIEFLVKTVVSMLIIIKFQ